MSTGMLVAVDVLAWLVISAAVGAAAGFVPDRLLDADSALTRIRPAEAGGRAYRRALRVHRWKDRLPEVHGFGPRSHASKASLAGRAAVPSLLRETRRAEYVHVAIAAAGPVFFAWNPPWLAAAMVAGGLGFNAPFIVVQRYNRARLVGLRARPEVARPA
jgi:glycosyl-4,4'-diaponeurosporenoate acyltransferase